MDRIIEFIDKMVKNGSAYQVGGDVYFRVNSDKKYGVSLSITPSVSEKSWQVYSYVSFQL